MGKIKDKAAWLVGAATGVAGILPAVGCRASCASCYGCAGAGVGLVLILLLGKLKGGRDSGVAQ